MRKRADWTEIVKAEAHTRYREHIKCAFANSGIETWDGSIRAEFSWHAEADRRGSDTHFFGHKLHATATKDGKCFDVFVRVEEGDDATITNRVCPRA